MSELNIKTTQTILNLRLGDSHGYLLLIIGQASVSDNYWTEICLTSRTQNGLG